MKLISASLLLLALASCAGLPHWFNAGVGGQAGSSSSGGINPLTAGGVFVSPGGNDTGNAGTNPAQPLKTLPQAVKNADIYGMTNIFIEEGYFDVSGGHFGDTMNGLIFSNISNLAVWGGWNNGFTSVMGNSVLDGKGIMGHVVRVESSTNLRLENLVLTGGDCSAFTTPEDGGGGLYMAYSSYCYFSNVTIISNRAKQGGGLAVNGGAYNNINAAILSNTAEVRGGGVYTWSASNMIGGVVRGNASTNGGGLYIDDEYNSITADCSYNYAIYGGALQVMGDYTDITGTYHNNEATWYGGAIYFENAAASCSVSITASNNMAVADSNNGLGGAVFLQGDNHTVNGYFYQNYAWYGGALFVNGYNCRIYGVYTQNVFYSQGGGVCFQSGGGHEVTADFTYNQTHASAISNATGSAVYANNTMGLLFDSCRFNDNNINKDGTAPQGVVVLTGGDSNTIVNSEFNNNYHFNRGKERLVILSGYSGWTSLVIASNSFHGSADTNTTAAIWEADAMDLSGNWYALYHNTFYTNNLGALYYDYISGIIDIAVQLDSANTGASNIMTGAGNTYN